MRGCGGGVGGNAGGGGGGTYRLGVGLEEEGGVVKPVFAFGVVGHGGRRGVRLALGGWCWLAVDFDGGRFVAGVSVPFEIVVCGRRRAAGGVARSIGAVVCRRGSRRW